MNENEERTVDNREQALAAFAEKGMLAGANLAGIDLAGVDFTMLAGGQPRFFGLNLEGAKLGNSNLAGAIIAGVNLEGADLQGVRLTGSIIIASNLEGATLTGSDLSQSRLLAVNVSGVDFSEVKVEGTRSSALDWEEAAVPPAETPPSLVPIPAWVVPAMLGLIVLLIVWRLRGKKEAEAGVDGSRTHRRSLGATGH